MAVEISRIDARKNTALTLAWIKYLYSSPSIMKPLRPEDPSPNPIKHLILADKTIISCWQPLSHGVVGITEMSEPQMTVAIRSADFIRDYYTDMHFGMSGLWTYTTNDFSATAHAFISRNSPGSLVSHDGREQISMHRSSGKSIPATVFAQASISLGQWIGEMIDGQRYTQPPFPFSA